MRFYSQKGEDSILWEFFKNRRSGTYVDIGAMDGLRNSNTYYFEKLGWSGMCVEAHPKYAGLCRKNRPGSINIYAAVGSQVKQFTEFCASPFGAASCIKAINTKRICTKNNQNIRELKIIRVPMVTMNFLLQLHGITSVDYVSVDVEGTEIDVLRGFNLERYKPRLVILEHNFLVNIRNMRKYMHQKGYHFARSIRINSFYCRTKKDASVLKAIEPKKSDPTPHPFRK